MIRLARADFVNRAALLLVMVGLQPLVAQEAAPKADGDVLKGSEVSLEAESITLSDALVTLQKQTGNQVVDLRAQFGQEVTNPEISVAWKKYDFWRALDDLVTKANVALYLQTGEPYLGLTGDTMMSASRLATYAGPLRIVPKRLQSTINYENDDNRTSLQIEVAWEPKLRPISFELSRAQLKILDDQGNKLDPISPPQPGQPEDAEPMPIRLPVNRTMVAGNFVIDLTPPPANAKMLKEVSGVFNVIIPASIKSFRFSKLEKAKDQVEKSDEVKVTLMEFQDLGDGFWAADMLLEFDSSGSAFESYETWFYENECFLQRADGTRFAENGGTTLIESGEGRIGIQYRFVDAPGKLADYRLVYRSPSRISRAKVPFKFQDLRLPRQTAE